MMFCVKCFYYEIFKTKLAPRCELEQHYYGGCKIKETPAQGQGL